MTTTSQAGYDLYYWPSIQGRGEFVRLAFEAAGVPYRDVTRLPESQGGGVKALMRVLQGEREGVLPYAPPFLEHEGLMVSHVANILRVVGPKLGLVPDDEASRTAAHQYQLTITDLLFETHESHHPIAADLYYEDQKPEAKKRSSAFLDKRVPKYLGYFERALQRNAASGGRHVVGAALSYVDLSLFQVMSGLGYAFPRATAALEPKIPLLVALRDRVAALPRVASYLSSERRIPFNEHGLFRRYPELDA